MSLYNRALRAILREHKQKLACVKANKKFYDVLDKLQTDTGKTVYPIEAAVLTVFIYPTEYDDKSFVHLVKELILAHHWIVEEKPSKVDKTTGHINLTFRDVVCNEIMEVCIAMSMFCKVTKGTTTINTYTYTCD